MISYFDFRNAYYVVRLHKYTLFYQAWRSQFKMFLIFHFPFWQTSKPQKKQRTSAQSKDFPETMQRVLAPSRKAQQLWRTWRTWRTHYRSLVTGFPKQNLKRCILWAERERCVCVSMWEAFRFLLKKPLCSLSLSHIPRFPFLPLL